MFTVRRLTSIAIASLALLVLGACRDVAGFTTAGDHFEGSVVEPTFVRAGLAGDLRLCLTLDADRLQDAPGAITSSDGRFHTTPLRPIPQLWHDPLSLFSFGEGRVKNLLYMATPAGDAGEGDVLVVVSLMQNGGVEVRLVRGAPPSADASLAVSSSNLFGVFTLSRAPGPCE